MFGSEISYFIKLYFSESEDSDSDKKKNRSKITLNLLFYLEIFKIFFSI